jgi:NAD(P)-dependent dehydrogenase (short-subunit alcohol dehydrogenase family)
MMLAGRVALVTGASHGTGVDIARALAAEGARVAVHYRSDRAAAEALASAIRAGGGMAEAFAADVARSEEVRRLTAEVELRLGALGIVVNNAGPFNDTAFSELAEADWDYVMNANLKAVYLTSQLAAPGMRRAGWRRSR